MEITAQNNQSLFDIALMVSGSAEAAFDIALENGMSITDTLTQGQVLQYSGTPINKKVVEYYVINDIKPATDYHEDGFVGDGVDIG
jgi:hypothetical protein